MDLFLLSSALTFLAYECLAYADIPRRKEWFRIGNNTVAFDEKSARWMQRIFIGVIVFVFFACLLYLYEGLSPIVRSTRTNINIISGFLFGPLFAIWLNGIFYSPPQKPLSRGQIFGGIGLVLFCIIGLAGQQAGKVFEQLARKISGFKGLGVEVSLSDQGPRKSAGPTKLAGTAGQNFASSSGSIGLSYVGQLDDVIERDHDYLSDLKAAFGGADIAAGLSQQLDGAVGLANHAITPPVKCLAAWFEATADATFVNDHLRIFVGALRQFSTLNEEGRPDAVSRIFVKGMAAIALDVELSRVREGVETGCSPLFNIFCPTSIESKPDTTVKAVPSSRKKPPKYTYSIKDKDRAGLKKCLAGLSGIAGQDQLPAPADQYARELSDYLRSFAAGDGSQIRPYFAITFAGLMAQLGQYETAVSTMDEWSSRQKFGKADSGATDWFILRARSIQAAYFDEWLSRQGDSVATAFLNEHLENLDVLRKGFADRLNNWDFASKALPRTKKTEFVLRRPGACFSHEPEPQLGLWQNLYTAYITAELTHIQIRLRHPSYRSRYLESTNTDIAWLAEQDLSCLAKYPDPTLIYAQILQAYADNLLKYSKARKDSESDDARNERLKNAQRVLTYGLELTDKQARLDLARSGGTFLSRVAPSDWVKTRESLQRTDAEVRAAMEE
jgi:hypothetical protein